MPTKRSDSYPQGRRSASRASHSLAALQLLLLFFPQYASPAQHQGQHQFRRRTAPQCESPPFLNSLSFRAHMPDCKILPKVCIDQGSYIIYDEETIVKSPNGEKVPKIDLKYVHWFHRHPDINPQGHGPEDTVMGTSLPFRDPVVRLPSPEEWAQRPHLVFSNCTLPLVMYSSWSHNLMEFFIRVPALVHMLQALHKAIDERATLVMAYPGNIPMPAFNRLFLQPFSKYGVTTLAALSSRRHRGYPSNSTFEGTHVRCFQRAVACVFVFGNFPAMYPAAQRIYQHYKASLPEPKGPGAPQFTSGPGILRVLFEVRSGVPGTRDWLNLGEVLEACNNGSMRLPPKLFNGSSSVGYSGYECRSHVFGNTLLDMAVVREVDVLITIHGAGSTHAFFMKEHSSYIEVRPYQLGTTYQEMPAALWPPMCNQNQYKVFCWFMNVDEAGYWTPGIFEKANKTSIYEGIMDKNRLIARDRNVKLKPEWVEMLLQQIVATGRNVEEFERRWNDFKLAVTFKKGRWSYVKHYI